MTQAIALPVHAFHEAALQRQNSLTKPAGSLGVLETVACRFAAWQGQSIPAALQPAITVFAGDHGVTAEGVSAYPSIVTGEMVKNFAAGGAAICVLARAISARLEVVDVGVLNPLPELPIVQAKVAAGTANLAVQAAMTAEQCAAALEVGRAAARRAVDQGANLLIAGDMGIGNTTPSAALICRLTGHSVDSIVGRGTGIDDAGLVNKRRAVQQGLDRLHGQSLDGTAVLAELGGLEIAAMAGFYLQGAALGVPSLVDGFIASAAALAARAIDPAVADWLLASHCSEETGHKLALEALQLSPLVALGMRLGEGSGAAACVPLLQLAIKLHAEMATFAQAGVTEKD